MNDSLQSRFDEAMVDIYRRAKDETDYTPYGFLNMVNERGGVEAAKHLLHSDQPSEGYHRLWELGRLDLSVEALVLEPDWAPLFSDEERDIARERLRSYDYDLPEEGPQPGEQEPDAEQDVRLERLDELRPGHEYTRKDLFDLLEVPEEQRGGDWMTGYHSEADGAVWFVFATLGSGGRTGHDYDNTWNGDRLLWRGRTDSRADHPSIQKMTSESSDVHVFTRDDDRSPFVYRGNAFAAEVRETVPVTVVWKFPDPRSDLGNRAPGEHRADTSYTEGAVQRVTLDAYERDPSCRRQCLEHWGRACRVCGFDFEETFGDVGAGYVEVHHLTPLSEIGQEHEVDPVEDLRPVCPNCHAILHKRRPPYSLDELRQIRDEHS